MRSSLDGALLYLVAEHRVGGRLLADMVPDLVAAGVDLVQLREKEMEAGDILRVGAPLLEACRSAGVPFILNDRPDIALALGAPGVHLGTNDLPTAAARRILGESVTVGRSTHSEEDISHALENEDPDYIAVGPVFETPTKPGRPAAGIDLIAHAAERVTLPWFAIGGIDEETLPDVIQRGARRVVVVRAITEANDPPAAAERLKKMLEEAQRI